MIFVIQYREDPDTDLNVLQECCQTLEEAQRYIENRPNSPAKDPCNEYRYYTDADEEYRISEVTLPWSLRELMPPESCSGCVNEAASWDQDCCWYCSRNPWEIRQDKYWAVPREEGVIHEG